jgi:DNA-binding transcriptional ArsR family regulator
MPDVLDDARALIESRLAEIEAEAGRIERALAGLGEGSAAPRRGPGRPPSSAASAPSKSRRGPRRRPSSKRAKRGQRQEELLAAIKKMSGASPAELADAIGVSQSQAYGLIRKAEAAGQIEKKGQGFVLKS